MLRDMMESILKNSDAVLGVEWKSGPNSSELLLEQEDGHGRMVFHPLFPGVTLAFIQVNASNWPESEANAELRPLLINYCAANKILISMRRTATLPTFSASFGHCRNSRLSFICASTRWNWSTNCSIQIRAHQKPAAFIRSFR